MGIPRHHGKSYFCHLATRIILTLNAKTSPDQTYNDGAAILTGRKCDFEQPSPFADRVCLGDPEETPKPIPTVSSSIVSTPTSGSDSEGGKTNVGAIVGGMPKNLDFE